MGRPVDEAVLIGEAWRRCRPGDDGLWRLKEKAEARCTLHVPVFRLDGAKLKHAKVGVVFARSQANSLEVFDGATSLHASCRRESGTLWKHYRGSVSPPCASESVAGF